MYVFIITDCVAKKWLENTNLREQFDVLIIYTYSPFLYGEHIDPVHWDKKVEYLQKLQQYISIHVTHIHSLLHLISHPIYLSDNLYSHPLIYGLIISVPSDLFICTYQLLYLSISLCSGFLGSGKLISFRKGKLNLVIAHEDICCDTI